jgi:toluene monooxygenase system ferredoxin subunit
MTTDDLWSGEMRAVTVAGQPILLVVVEGSVCAYHDRCVHQGVPLSEGRLEDGQIVCRAHEWRYDARTGRGTNPRDTRLRPCAVRLEGGLILVDPDRRPEERP